MAAAPSHEFGYPDPRGLPGLREALAQYLARVRGVRTTPDRIIICSGFVQALSLLSTALHRRGAGMMAVESHGFRMHREVIHAAGLATRPLTVDAHGARISELGSAPADAVLLTPAHQFPLGVPLAAQRRAAVAGWARDRGTLVIEDDYDGEFRYDRRPLGALQGLAPDLVAYAGTASKSLAPGLSLAWLAAPPPLLDVLVETKRLSDGHTGVIEQLAWPNSSGPVATTAISGGPGCATAGGATACWRFWPGGPPTSRSRESPRACTRSWSSAASCAQRTSPAY